MRTYELITIIDPARLDEGKKALDDIQARYQGKTASEDDWGDKRMPHDDGTMPMGRFLFRTLEMAPEKVAEFTRELNIHAAIARHMIHVTN